MENRSMNEFIEVKQITKISNLCNTHSNSENNEEGCQRVW
jgi:hypothetical protein